MKPLLKITLFSLLLFVGPQVHSMPTCKSANLKALFENLSKFPPQVTRKAGDIVRFTAQTKTAPEVFFLKRWTRELRDSFKEFLQIYLNKNRFDLTDPSHPTKASFLSRHFLGGLTPIEQESIEAFNVPALMRELMDDINIINQFPADIVKFASEAGNIASKRAAFSSLDAAAVARHKNKVWVALYPPDPNNANALFENIVEIPFSSRVDFKIEKKGVNAWFPWFVKSADEKALLNKARQRGYDQARRLAKVYIFYSTYYKHKKLHTGKLPVYSDEVQNFIKAMESLFEPDSQITKAEFRVSEDLLQPLKWQQIKAELKLAFVNLKITELKDLIEALPEKEREFIGTQNLSTANLFQRIRWGVVGASAAIPSGGLTTWYSIYSYLNQDSIAKDECAQKENEEDFKKCAIEYLNLRAQTKTAFYTEKELASLLNQDGSINDADLIAEVVDITNRRNAFVYNQNKGNGIKPSLENEVEKNLLGSDAYLKDLVRIADESKFLMILLDDNHLKGFLMFNFPIAFSTPGNKEKVREIVTSDNPELRQKLLDQLSSQEYTHDLATTLRNILETRKNIQNSTIAESSLRVLVDTVGPLLKR